MAHDQMVKKMATEKLDANNDLVKMLNSLGARAAAFTIRDKQAIGLTGVHNIFVSKDYHDRRIFMQHGFSRVAVHARPSSCSKNVVIRLDIGLMFAKTHVAQVDETEEQKPFCHQHAPE